jgi:hypothetical protein
VAAADNWSHAAESYTFYLYVHIEPYLRTGAKLFTADYGLYWFNYEAGYDVLLAEFGWNHTREIQAALCRGAASAHGKDWGIIITWTYAEPPYLESAEALYDDLTMAYHSGAKYIIVFEYEIMGEEHFGALRRFWSYMKCYPNRHGILNAETAYILPKDYGFGFRKNNDTIWGLWVESENKIWRDVNTLAERCGLKFDVVYNDERFTGKFREQYSFIYLWSEPLS